jgi:hypothetical protein
LTQKDSTPVASVQKVLDTPVKSTSSLNTKKNKPDTGTDRAVVVSRAKYQIYYFLIKKNFCQEQVARKLNIRRQTVNEHTKSLEILGLIKAIDPDGNPKYYKPTSITPITEWGEGKRSTPVVSGSAKEIERRVGKPLKTVRDHTTGQFKGKKEPPRREFHRDYDTVVSVDGKRVPMLRVHSLAFSCNIVREPGKNVPWEKKKGPNGMDQWVLHHKFPNNKTEIDALREVEITFVRQKTGTYDELVIYLPEKFLFEHELKAVEAMMEQYALTARKWFQNKYKTWLGLPLMYRPMEIAREIFEPGLKRYVEENGMVKVKTPNGYAMVDESQKGFPEREFTSIEEVQADLHIAERVLSIEEQQIQFQQQVRMIMDLMNQQQTVNQQQFKQVGDLLKQQAENVQELMGFKKKVEGENKETMYQ